MAAADQLKSYQGRSEEAFNLELEPAVSFLLAIVRSFLWCCLEGSSRRHDRRQMECALRSIQRLLPVFY